MLQHVPDAIFIGPRYTWGPIYGSECLKQTELCAILAIQAILEIVAILAILAKLAKLAILATLAILAILANLRFINTSASQSSGG